jgi:hypothetical protein
MSTETSTLDKLNRLESLYRQGYQSDLIDRSLDKMLALENARIRRELSARVPRRHAHSVRAHERLSSPILGTERSNT